MTLLQDVIQLKKHFKQIKNYFLKYLYYDINILLSNIYECSTNNVDDA